MLAAQNKTLLFDIRRSINMLEIFIILMIVAGIYGIYEKICGKSHNENKPSDRTPDIGRDGPDRPEDTNLDDGPGD